jgi:hypothetical protein
MSGVSLQSKGWVLKVGDGQRLNKVQMRIACLQVDCELLVR